MQVCRESYSTIQGFYEKAFVHDGGPRSDSERYIRVNFEIDTMRVTQTAPPLLTNAPEAANVRNLTVELWDDEWFWPGIYRWKAESQYLAEFASLEILTIVYMQTIMRIDPYWLDEFYDLMADYYYTCIPVSFETRVVHADPINEGLTRDNFVQKDYEENRLLWEDGREFREDPDEPFPGTNTFSWKHVGCDCKEAAGTHTRWRFRPAPS
jgi:hypothetical protein